MGADIDDDFACPQHTCATILQGYFDRSRSDNATATHDKFGTAGLIGAEVEGDIPVDHVLLAPPNLRHVGRDWTGLCAELRGVAGKMRDACAPNFVLAGQTGDGGTRAPYPTSR